MEDGQKILNSRVYMSWEKGCLRFFFNMDVRQLRLECCISRFYQDSGCESQPSIIISTSKIIMNLSGTDCERIEKQEVRDYGYVLRNTLCIIIIKLN